MAVISPGRKIPEEYENPVDNLIIKLAEYVHPPLYYIGIIPNHVTIASIVTGLVSALMIYKSRYFSACALAFLAYFLDCLDGNMARTFDRVTEFGDFLDHVGDVVKAIAQLAAIAFNPNISPSVRALFITTMAVSILGSMIHMGCQEQVYHKHRTSDDSLSSLRYLCKRHPEHTVRYTRFIGIGTSQMLLYVFLLTMGVIAHTSVHK